MEWLAAGLFAVGMLIWSAFFLIRKLVRFGPVIATLEKQLSLLSEASAKTPEIAKLASSINDDPVVHVARRLELKRAAKRLKLARERRLRSRVFFGR
jgi:hypothetical protein